MVPSWSASSELLVAHRERPTPMLAEARGPPCRLIPFFGGQACGNFSGVVDRVGHGATILPVHTGRSVGTHDRHRPGGRESTPLLCAEPFHGHSPVVRAQIPGQHHAVGTASTSPFIDNTPVGPAVCSASVSDSGPATAGCTRRCLPSSDRSKATGCGRLIGPSLTRSCPNPQCLVRGVPCRTCSPDGASDSILAWTAPVTPLGPTGRARRGIWPPTRHDGLSGRFILRAISDVRLRATSS